MAKKEIKSECLLIAHVLYLTPKTLLEATSEADHLFLPAITLTLLQSKNISDMRSFLSLPFRVMTSQ